MKKKFRPKAKRRFMDTVHPITVTLQRFAQVYAQVMHDLTPLITESSMPPAAAAVLVACYADAIMTGNGNKAKHKMSEDDIRSGVNLFLMLWKQGNVIAPDGYPYTLEETLREDDRGVEA